MIERREQRSRLRRHELDSWQYRALVSQMGGGDGQVTVPGAFLLELLELASESLDD